VDKTKDHDKELRFCSYHRFGSPHSKCY